MNYDRELELLLDLDIALNTHQIAINSAMPEPVKEMNWIANTLYAEQYRKEIKARWLRATGFIAAMVMLGFTIGLLSVPIMLILFVIWCRIDIRVNRQNASRSSERAWEIVNEKLQKEAVIREAMYRAAVWRLRSS